METTWRGTNASDAHAFELWFHGGEVRFYMHAATDRAADKFRRRVGNNYANSQVFTVDDDAPGFPTLDPGRHVAGGHLTLRRHYYLPIRHYRDDRGFERDPYGEVTSEMLSTPETAVVVQVVFRPVPSTWTDGGGLLSREGSVDDVADGLRQGTVVGWSNPRVRDASTKDKTAAKIVEEQRGALAFDTNIRVLAASPDPHEAESRASGIAGMFANYYNAATEQGFDPVPAATTTDLAALLERMRDREWADHGDDRMILTVDELASAAHIPNGEIETPKIDWKLTQSGTRIPNDAARRDRGRGHSTGGDDHPGGAR